VALITQPHLAPRLKKVYSYTSTPVCVFKACYRVNFTLPLHITQTPNLATGDHNPVLYKRATFFPRCNFDPFSDHGFARSLGFTITLRHTTLSKTPLDEGPARRRDLYLTTHNTTDNRRPCRRRDSNPKSQQVKGKKRTP
jgi:hypothetical protein